MNLKDFSEIFDKYGFKGLIFAFFIVVIVALVKSKWFSEFLSRISDKFVERFMKKNVQEMNSKLISESDIQNHDIFNYIDFWMYSKVPTIAFSTDYRTAVFRKYLIVYLRCYKKNIAEFVNSKDYQNMDDARVWKALLNLINKTVYDYETEMKDMGIPDIIIQKMKLRNNDTITLTFDLIEGICGSQFYHSEKNFLKVYSIMNILLSVLENTISNCENVCNSINGQLKGLTFDGKTEP